MSEEIAAFSDLPGGEHLLDGPVGGHEAHHPLDVGGATVVSSEVFVTDGRTDPALGVPPPSLRSTWSRRRSRSSRAHDVPFVSVRCISDLCAPDGAEFREHLDGASARAAAVARVVVLGLTA